MIIVIIAMINLLIKGLDKEMTEAEVTEKDAQATSLQNQNDLPAPLNRGADTPPNVCVG